MALEQQFAPPPVYIGIANSLLQHPPFGGQTSRSLGEGCPSCIYSSDPSLKMWTSARAWMNFPSVADLLLELVACQTLFLLQLTGIDIKGLKFGLAHSLVNFKRKLQLVVGCSTSSLQGLLLHREKSLFQGICWEHQITPSSQTLRPRCQQVPPPLRRPRVGC